MMIKLVTLNIIILFLCIECAKLDMQPTIFSYSKLKVATKDFCPNMKLGQGTYEVIYKVTTSSL
jgi:hypothetical protein